MTTDKTFLTNEEGNTLKDRFGDIIKNSKFFDCLVVLNAFLGTKH